MIVGDRERWKRISPLLDGLLDLPPDARAARLEALQAHDPALAAELAELVADAARAERAQFLAASPGVFAAPEKVAPTLVGARLGTYVLEAPLGQGGMGAVWRARRADGRYAGQVALKLLHLSLVGPGGMRRFEREGAILARLSHPNIARLLDAGISDGGQPYLVLELVEGARIDHHCDAERLSVAERIALFRAVLEAVAHAHRHLVIHRDLKPSNILVATDGTVKLLDFGIAKLLQGEGDAPTDLTGDRRGALTPDYAAPEQLRGEAVTTATDVYALGVLLYQLLSGQHPTAPAETAPADRMRATLQTDPARLASAATASRGPADWNAARVAAERRTSVARLRRELVGDLENIVAKALRKPPSERYPSIDAFADDLRRWSVREPVTARPDTLAYRSARFVERHRGAVAAATLTLVAIVAGVVGTISQARRAEQQRAIAVQETETARQERNAALEQARLQRGMSEFQQLLMRDAAGGDPGAIRRQLDRASVLIEQNRFEHPIVKVALLRQVAGRYVEIGDIAASSSLLREAIASTEGTELAAPTSVVPVNLACSLARNLHEMGDPAGALAEIERAERRMAAGAKANAPTRAECAMQRSFVETTLGRYGAGVAILRDALQMLAAAGVRDGEQPRILRSALSRALMEQGDHAAALAIAQPLLAESVAGQGHESFAVLRRASVVTSLTRLGGDPLAALALSEADRAVASRLLGNGQVDAAIELEHARILLDLDRDGEAAATAAAAAAAADKAGRRFYVLPARLVQVEALLGAGRVAEARALYDAIRPGRDAAAPPQRTDAARVAALLAAGEGDRAAARAAIADAARRVDAAGGVADPHAFCVAMIEGELRLGGEANSGDALAPAERALAAARHAALDPTRSAEVGRALLLRARVLAGAGEADAAAEAAGRALPALQATLGADQASTIAARTLARR